MLKFVVVENHRILNYVTNGNLLQDQNLKVLYDLWHQTRNYQAYMIK